MKQEVLSEIKNKYPNRTVMIVEYQEKVSSEMIQLHGMMLGGPIRPGMKLFIQNSPPPVIKEVYWDNGAPEKPSTEIPSGYSGGIAIVFDNSGWSKAAIKECIKNKIPLEIMN